MNTSNAQRNPGTYLLLLALQILGAIGFIWQTLPEFRQVAENPGARMYFFLGRLSFIFGSALFGIVVFRRLPELDASIDLLLSIKRGMILIGCLFALFCTALEVERPGQAFERGHRP